MGAYCKASLVHDSSVGAEITARVVGMLLVNVT